MRYRKTTREWKDIENDFYANGSPNDDLESEIQKGSLRCSKVQLVTKLFHN